MSKIQRCDECDQPTGKCQDDQIVWELTDQILCEDCYHIFDEQQTQQGAE